MEAEERKILIDLLQRQQEVYGTMRNLLRAQVKAFQSGDTDKLVVLVNEANGFRAKAATLEEDVVPLKKRWEEDRESIPQEERDNLLKRVDHIKKILEEVLELMGSLNENVTQKKDETQERIREVQRAQAARKGYGSIGQKQPDQSRFMDRNE
jgi:hypothetical protein